MPKAYVRSEGGTPDSGIYPARWVIGLAKVLVDVVIWIFAIVVAAWLRFELDVTRMHLVSLVIFALGVAALHVVVAAVFSAIMGRFQYGAFDEARSVGLVTMTVALISTVVLLVVGPEVSVPRSTALIAAPLALVIMGCARFVVRKRLQSRVRPAAQAERTLVFGAGYLGETAVRRMVHDAGSNFVPVALLDDDPAKARLILHGVKVVGGLEKLEEVARRTEATNVVIAIGDADADLVRRVSDAAAAVHLHVMVFPPLEEILAGKTKLSDLRDISIEDLIGRTPVDTHVESIAGYLAGKRVLVTGAGGSIGSELCRQILKYAPSELIMLDRDETGLQSAQLGTTGHGLLHTRDVVLADIRDLESLNAIFADRKPDVVFHAAALKHLPMLEQYPDEAWKTNVIGTLNVLRAAEAADVETFVNISTDKAANPTSVLGHSKRVAERLTAWMASATGRPYISVRFGNVIGSRGSMLPTFQTLIEAGGPLTVTHPDVTRYFMTIPEACQLVVQAGGIGRAGEVLILDMGEPVRILDVARRMIDMSGKDIEIVFTGLREGEKLHEELIGFGESDSRPFHPKISHTEVEPLAPARLDIGGWKERMETATADTIAGLSSHRTRPPEKEAP
ncbi:nucleoside-diphosphate sugar epimerase/dehydratase [Zhihengliuella sp.]|uniref:polysaccharide biosynthesis protein n=1 Tax=Zhihengliuella sp. TaxID=1954483 RepID=UPI0028120380|nr:nucleoside-diphosphate sugar epimerase/dehydratase [Zhihengliuella sp.]